MRRGTAPPRLAVRCAVARGTDPKLRQTRPLETS